MWKSNLNVDITIKIDEYPIVIQYLLENNYDIGSIAWNADYNDPMTMLEIMFTGNSFNYGTFSNPKYDKLVLNARKTSDNVLRMNYMIDAEKILMDEMPLIPICHRAFTLMLNPKLKGIVYNPLGKHKFNYCYIE